VIVGVGVASGVKVAVPVTVGIRLIEIEGSGVSVKGRLLVGKGTNQAEG
jgi:hypothetical protein